MRTCARTPGSSNAALAGLLLACGLAPWFTASAAAQAAPERELELPYPIDTGWSAAGGADPRVGSSVPHSFSVHVERATSLRLGFGSVELGGGSLVLTSAADGAVQELDAVALVQWQNTSAYFNGDTVQVDVVQPAGARPSRVVLERVVVELANDGWIASQCGTTDDRVPSSDPRAARVLPIGCSSFVIDDCNHCLLTAGHCLGGTNVIEFDVPNSLPNGNIVHPSPDKQYAVDAASVQGFGGPIGNDWGYFGVFANPNTGLTPAQAQGNWFGLAPALPEFQPGLQLAVTGYGIDSTPPEQSQVQQRATGPWTGQINTWELFYEVDTTAGSSGSPVVAAGLVIGIHTDGGCNNSLGNAGTGITRPTLADALAHPLGVCAGACDGDVTSYCTGKLNSQGCVAAIATSGVPTLSGGAGSFVLTASEVVSQKAGLLFYGVAPAVLPLLGGTLCVNPPLRRTPLAFSGGSAEPDCSGFLSFDFGAWAGAAGATFLTAGQTVYAQFHYRDPASSLVAPVGLSDAVAFVPLP